MVSNNFRKKKYIYFRLLWSGLYVINHSIYIKNQYDLVNGTENRK